MPVALVECVANFSEGREASTVDAIIAAIGSSAGVLLLDRHVDPDHNRSVITFAGSPGAAVEGAVRGVERAVSLIDLRRHDGVHPRIGAADVVPFVPLEGLTLEDCVCLAVRAGDEIWRRCGVPVYFYEAAARRPDRVNLAALRRGRFEDLRERVLTDPGCRPDIGGPALHPSAGATAVGARNFLIAYNVNLAGAGLEIARQIAGRVRHSSGGFPGVKALGVELASRGLAQVTMNLTDFEHTPLDSLFEAIESEADRLGAIIASSEIVGLVPRRAFEMAPRFFERAENYRPDVILENRLSAIQSK
jgi:glutamate formiminotransferase